MAVSTQNVSETGKSLMSRNQAGSSRSCRENYRQEQAASAAKSQRSRAVDRPAGNRRSQNATQDNAPNTWMTGREAGEDQGRERAWSG